MSVLKELLIEIEDIAREDLFNEYLENKTVDEIEDYFNNIHIEPDDLIDVLQSRAAYAEGFGDGMIICARILKDIINQNA